MTADEIRAIVKNIDKEAGISPHDLIWIEALIEIAAQLAELNSKLDRVIAPTNESVGAVIGTRQA